MLINFFFTLPLLPVSAGEAEYLTLLEAEGGVTLTPTTSGPDVSTSSTTWRTALVGRRGQPDKFDRAFAAHFISAELLADFTQ